ncbi:MAG: patatin-like phospholipase family protein [Bacteroidaceae bacterium]|nr:patatin-like phospholipase family protein [Bacteroidaceae bacterium]
MKKVLLFLLAALLFLPIYAEERKKVAVVLSGGGAKGVAHIRALKVIEEAGIPIDYVVGTSMGAIVGGLYSIGFTTDQLDTLVATQDWGFLLSDNTERNTRSLVNRENADQYLFSVPLNSFGKSKHTKENTLFGGGVIKGRNIARLFTELTEGYHDSIDFNTLPIPFACVAYDIVKGDEVVFHSGVLATAMRASMSIPGAFAPIRLNGKVLVDGGMCNNYPVDVARQMGADFIIGVDVQDTLRSAGQLNSLTEIAGQIINLICVNKNADNIRDSDVHIKVPVHGYSAASFNKSAIDTLLARGEAAARANWDKLLVLKEKTLQLPVSFRPKERAERILENTDSIRAIPEITPEQASSSISVGARFDTELLASILFNAHMRFKGNRQPMADLTVRLGKESFGRLRLSSYVDQRHAFQGIFSYQFIRNDVNLYHKGERMSNYIFSRHEVDLGLLRSWHDIACSFGVQFDYYHYNNVLVHPEEPNPMNQVNVHFFSYFYRMAFDNYDKRVYPTQGMKWNVGAAFFTDNFWSYDKKPGILVANFSWETALPLRSRLTLLPAVYGRFVWKQTPPYSLGNFIGGPSFGRFTEQQLPFMGIGYVEMLASKAVASSVKLRQRIGANQYLTFTGNVALASSQFKKLLTDDFIYGGAVTYGYNTAIGPLEASFYWSDRTDKPDFLINLGFNF